MTYPGQTSANNPSEQPQNDTTTHYVVAPQYVASPLQSGNAPTGQYPASPEQKNRAPWVVLAAFLVVALAVGAIALTRNGARPEAAPNSSVQPVANSASESTTPVAEPTTEAPETVAPTSTVATAAPSENSERGLLPKMIGDPGGMVASDGSAQLMQFVVTKVTPNFQCPGAYADAPKHGMFLAIDVNFETFDLPTDQFYSGSFYASSGDWGIIALDNTKQQDTDSISTYGCLDDGASGLEELGPNQKLSMTIILDTNQVHGYITYTPSDLQSGGWEIKY